METDQKPFNTEVYDSSKRANNNQVQPLEEFEPVSLPPPVVEKSDSFDQLWNELSMPCFKVKPVENTKKQQRSRFLRTSSKNRRKNKKKKTKTKTKKPTEEMLQQEDNSKMKRQKCKTQNNEGEVKTPTKLKRIVKAVETMKNRFQKSGKSEYGENTPLLPKVNLKNRQRLTDMGIPKQSKSKLQEERSVSCPAFDV